MCPAEGPRRAPVDSAGLRPVVCKVAGQFRADWGGETAMRDIRFLGLVLLNQITNVGATTGFALSGRSPDMRRFLAWQIMGSFFGLGTQLTFAGMVRFSSIELANAIGIGLAFVTVQVVTAEVFFHAGLSAVQWLGTLLVFTGILLLAAGR